MRKIIQKVITFYLEDIANLVKNSKSLLRPENTECSLSILDSKFVFTTKNDLTYEEIKNLISAHLQEIGENDAFEIEFINDNFVCTQILEGSNEPAQPKKILTMNLADAIANNGPLDDKISVRARTCFLDFIRQNKGITLEDFINTPKRPPVRNFGKKTRLEIIELLSDLGIAPKEYKIFDWFQ